MTQVIGTDVFKEPKTGRYVAFFDLDNTILSINSGAVLVREAHRSGLMSTSDFLHAIYLSWLFKFNLRDTAGIVLEMGKWLKGVEVDGATIFCEHIVKHYLIDAIRPEIYSEIRFHKLNNAEIVILSSAVMQICKPLGSHIGADNVICTVMEVADGVFTGWPVDKFCFEEEKKIRLKQYCEKNNHSLSEAYYYGDSISDLAALEVVGHPVCVQPDRKLSRATLGKGWRVI